MEWLEALVLGVVQGLTEFLPVSSDGHLTITQLAFDRLQGYGRGGKENLFFDVMLHLGTLAAIAVYFRAVVRTGLKGLLGSNEVPPEYRRPAVVRVGLLAVVATLPLVPDKLFFMDYIEATFQSLRAAGVGFLITAAVLLLTLRLDRGKPGKGPSETTWLDALLIGVAQMFAPLPGVSRSGLTVAAALGLGLSRSWAVGFSLLMAVPAILGAAVFEIKDVDRATLTADRVGQTVLATVVAGPVGYGAIIWLVKIVRAGRLWYFSVYLIALGAAVLTVAALSGEPAHARRAQAMDRPVRVSAPGAGLGGRAGRAGRPVARTFRVGAGAGDPGARGEAPGGRRPAGVVLGGPLAGGA
jgi:undecaprenyl-diphosphatase